MKSMGPSEVRQAKDLSVLETVLAVSGVNVTPNDDFLFQLNTSKNPKEMIQ